MVSNIPQTPPPKTSLQHMSAIYLALVKDFEEVKAHRDALSHSKTQLSQRCADLAAEIHRIGECLDKVEAERDVLLVGTTPTYRKLLSDHLNYKIDRSLGDGYVQCLRRLKELEAERDIQAKSLNDVMDATASLQDALTEALHRGNELEAERDDLNRRLTDAAREKQHKHDYAMNHPAWWEGNDAGVEGAVDAINRRLDNPNDGGTFASPGLNTLWQRISSLITPDARGDTLRRERAAASKVERQELRAELNHFEKYR